MSSKLLMVLMGVLLVSTLSDLSSAQSSFGRKARPSGRGGRCSSSRDKPNNRDNGDWLTTAETRPPTDQGLWEDYKQQFGKQYDTDEEERIHHTIFARRVEMLTNRVLYCQLDHIAFDEDTDAEHYLMTEEEKLNSVNYWLEFHGYTELATLPQYKMSLFIIHYFNKKVFKDCADYDLPYSEDLEELLF